MNMSAENTAGDRWIHSEWGSWGEELSEWEFSLNCTIQGAPELFNNEGENAMELALLALCCSQSLEKCLGMWKTKTTKDKNFAEERPKSSWQFDNSPFNTFSCRKCLPKALRAWAEFPQTWKVFLPNISFLGKSHHNLPDPTHLELKVHWRLKLFWVPVWLSKKCVYCVSFPQTEQFMGRDKFSAPVNPWPCWKHYQNC